MKKFQKLPFCSALSRDNHLEIDNQSNGSMGVLKRDIFTSRGYHVFAPWNTPGFEKSMLQINMGQSALGLMDVINFGVLSNFSFAEFYFGSGYDQRYHYEKQPQFTDEVASSSFSSVKAPNYAHLDLLNSPTFTLPPHQTADCISALSRGVYDEGEGQAASGLGGLGGSLKRDTFTSRGNWAFSPWNPPSAAKCLLQIYLGQSALGLMDVINLGALSNFSYGEFWFFTGYDTRYHMEKQPQFTDEVATRSFPSVYTANYAPLDRLKAPIFDLPPHQTSEGKFILILDYLGTYKYKI